jgi:hypothetical protein
MHPEPYHRDNVKALWNTTFIFHFSGGLGKPWSMAGMESENEDMRRLHSMYLKIFNEIP